MDMKQSGFAIVFVGVATFLGWSKPEAAAAFVTACILVALYGQLGSLVELSFGPLKAKLERNLSESEQLVAKLKAFSPLLVRAAISSYTRGSRLGGPDPVWQYTTAKELSESLRDLGISESEIQSARKDFVQFAIFDAGMNALGNLYRSYVEEERRTNISDVNAAIDVLSDADALEQFLSDKNLLTHERAALVDDIRWIVEHGDVRDEEQSLRIRARIG